MKHFTMFWACLVLYACTSSSTSQSDQATSAEAGDWKPLFDGKTTAGWRSYNSNTIGSAWKVENGVLFLDNSITTKEDRGDIITNDEFENFEFSIEWKIDSCGNSGIFYNVVEDPKYSAVYYTGPEMQVLDNECHPDAKIIKHRAGDLYDLISVSKETVKPAGEWNEAKIVSNNARYEFWLNGTKTVEFIMHDKQWNDRVAGSKFNTMPDFGKATKGHIALQDHGDRVWYRNIKIKEIK
jgi:hypothetical protein